MVSVAPSALSEDTSFALSMAMLLVIARAGLVIGWLFPRQQSAVPRAEPRQLVG
jgi:hypothetical protein